MSEDTIISMQDAKARLMIKKIIIGFIDVLHTDVVFAKDEIEAMIDRSCVNWDKRNTTIGYKVGGECIDINVSSEKDRILLDKFVLETNSAHLKDIVLIQILHGIDLYKKRIKIKLK